MNVSTSAVADLFTEKNWSKTQRFATRHEESQKTGPWISKKTWDALCSLSSAIGKIAIAMNYNSQQSNKQYGLVNTNTTNNYNISVPQNKKQQAANDQRTGAAIGVVGTTAGTIFTTLYIGRIWAIKTEIDKMTHLKSLECNDFEQKPNDPAVIQLRKAMESKQKALETEKKYTWAKLIVTVSGVACGLFLVSAFFLAPPFMAIPGILLGFSCFVGIAIKGSEYFISDIAKNNTKTTEHLKKLEELKINHDSGNSPTKLNNTTYTLHTPSMNPYATPIPSAPQIDLEEHSACANPEFKQSYVENGVCYNPDGSLFTFPHQYPSYQTQENDFPFKTDNDCFFLRH